MLMDTLAEFTCSDPVIQTLYDQALSKCEQNIRLFGTTPVLVEGGGYNKIWLETQPMGGEMYALYRPDVAWNNIRLFMDTQREDGRLPGSIQYLDGVLEPQFNKFQGFCFPYPALQLLYLRGLKHQELMDLKHCLESWDAYLWRTRDTRHHGVLESFCVYDTGEDACTRYGDAPNWWTEEHAPEGLTTVPMASMDLMGWSCSAREALAHLCRLLNDPESDAWTRRAGEVRETIRRRLWDESAGTCFDQDADGNPIRVLSHNPLRCMYWGAFSQSMADRFVREHLLNPREFWTPMPLPSIAVSDPAFRNAPENNWSGQPEGLTYQRAILALERYGYHELVPVLGRHLIRSISENGYLFTQQFDPFTGEPSRVGFISHAPLGKDSDEPVQDAYGPTLLAVLEYLAHMYGIRPDLGQVSFSFLSGIAFTYHARFYGHDYRLESNGCEAFLSVDGHRILEHPCGYRIRTTMDGHILYVIPLESIKKETPV